MSGKVKWFSNEKGYGFITAEDGNEYFFHYTGIDMEGFKTITRDTAVTFQLETGDDGKTKAVGIKAA